MNFRFSFLVLLALLGLRCVNSEILPVEYPEPIVTSSLFIAVYDIDGEPVQDALVRLGDQALMTDQYGTCFMMNVKMPQRVYFTVDKPGYFKGSRRLYVSEGQIQYAQVMLEEKEEVGSFSATSGGQVTIDQSTTLVFPSDAISMEDGTPYYGLVHVSGYTIQGDDPLLSVRMPGSLEGRYQNEESGILSSYGMVAVELNSTSGEELNVKQGYKVDLSMNIPESMRSGAPSKIPMWYFDEEVGEWQHEGYAQFNGESYETQVSHFSIWNCDDWNQSVLWDATFVDESGKPIPNLEVCMTVPSVQQSGCAFTGNSGHIQTYLPSNELITLEVTSDCGNVIYSKQIGPFLADGSFGVVTISLSSTLEAIYPVSGFAVDCNNDPIKEGVVRISAGSMQYITTINPADGSFTQNIVSCPLAPLSVEIIDQISLKRSEPFHLVFSPQMDVGTIQVCDEFQPFVKIGFEGFEEQYTFNDPVVTFSSSEQRIYVQVSDGLPGGTHFSFDFACIEPGPCDEESFDSHIILPNGQEVSMLDLQVGLVEYGIVGDAIRGNIFGIVNGGGNGQGGSGFTFFTGSFSILRTE